jgi:hypothetical protein
MKLVHLGRDRRAGCPFFVHLLVSYHLQGESQGCSVTNHRINKLTNQTIAQKAMLYFQETRPYSRNGPCCPPTTTTTITLNPPIIAMHKLQLQASRGELSGARSFRRLPITGWPHTLLALPVQNLPCWRSSWRLHMGCPHYIPCHAIVAHRAMGGA